MSNSIHIPNSVVLKATYLKLISCYTENTETQHILWSEIATRHSEEGRFYHTLSHLENLLTELREVQSGIEDMETMLFTLFYHDSIYDVSRTDNEEQSAKLATKRMGELAVSQQITEKCKAQILATKQHDNSTDPDTCLFNDADLAVLGKDRELYTAYAVNVRKEYAMYPDTLYIPGRIRVLTHFLEMERIYQTTHFQNHYEIQARKNLLMEKAWLKSGKIHKIC